MNFIDHTSPPTDINFHNPNNPSTTYTYRLLQVAKIVGPFPKKTLTPKEKLIKDAHWKDLKQWLGSKSSGKCWFCESKESRSTSDVEHFRPKNQVKIGNRKLKYPTFHVRAGDEFEGYWWLSYEWTNYRLSCQRCNRLDTDSSTKIVHGKGDSFPLVDENQRCWDLTGNHLTEAPLLLDPCIQADTTHLLHTLSGEIKPVASDVNTVEYIRASFSIKLLGLNAYGVVEKKREIKADIELILDNYIGENSVDADFERFIERNLNPAREYYTFVKGIILQYCEDIPWLDSKLASMGL